MLINEACRLTNLTKKAITYYEKQKLIDPNKDVNGYREYTKEDVRLLNEISLYRKLDISIKDIKSILKSSNKNNEIEKILIDKKKKEVELKIQKSYLEKLINSGFEEDEVIKLNEEIINHENNNGSFIKNELKRAFPDGIGTYLSYHFAPYLNESMNSVDKYNAWISIVEFLDNVPDIKIPKIIQLGYDSMSDETQLQIANKTKEKMLAIMKAQGDELEKYKKELLESIDKQNDKSIAKMMNPYFKFKKQLNEFFTSSGYYDVFIPNMKILSSEYKEYNEKLTTFNNKMEEELGIKYDENMRIIRVEK